MALVLEELYQIRLACSALKSIGSTFAAHRRHGEFQKHESINDRWIHGLPFYSQGRPQVHQRLAAKLQNLEFNT